MALEPRSATAGPSRVRLRAAWRTGAAARGRGGARLRPGRDWRGEPGATRRSNRPTTILLGTSPGRLSSLAALAFPRRLAALPCVTVSIWPTAVVTFRCPASLGEAFATSRRVSSTTRPFSDFAEALLDVLRDLDALLGLRADGGPIWWRFSFVRRRLRWATRGLPRLRREPGARLAGAARLPNSSTPRRLARDVR